MNWYAYAGGNPLMFVDPSGNFSVPAQGTHAVAGVGYGVTPQQQYQISQGILAQARAHPAVRANWGQAGRSSVGVVANGAVAIVAAPTALTGVGGVVTVYATYGTAAHSVNLVNALRGEGAVPTGPVEGIVAAVAPDDRTANLAAKTVDAVVPLVAGQVGNLASTLQSAKAMGWYFGGSESTTATAASAAITVMVYGAMTLDASAQLYDAYGQVVTARCPH